MLARKSLDKAELKTWIEIKRGALAHNYKRFRTIIGPKVKLWPVVKSNAYGHGIYVLAALMQKLGVDGFCVDSLIEGVRLRERGIKKPILVLGPTVPKLLGEALRHDIMVSVSNFEALKSLTALTHPPNFHLKIDTGMHRQGFYVEEIPRVIRMIHDSRFKIQDRLKGIYTHFASAKDINYPTYTEQQFKHFQKAVRILERAGFKNMVRHCAATGATLIDKKYHFDAVRVGIGLYGIYPSKELEIQVGSHKSRTALWPVLSWRTVISEVKQLNPGDYVGYDLAERVSRPTKLAILPIGYWHGFPRSLSGKGEVLVRKRRARVLGLVSMDLVAVDVTGIRCAPHDRVTLIGRDGEYEIHASQVAERCGTIPYEILTRLNPLIERTVVS